MLRRAFEIGAFQILQGPLLEAGHSRISQAEFAVPSLHGTERNQPALPAYGADGARLGREAVARKAATTPSTFLISSILEIGSSEAVWPSGGPTWTLELKYLTPPSSKGVEVLCDRSHRGQRKNADHDARDSQCAAQLTSRDVAKDCSSSGPLGAFAVKYGLVPRSSNVSIVSEQGTKMGRQSFVHIKLAYPPKGELPSRIEVGGSVVPTLKGELSGGW